MHMCLAYPGPDDAGAVATLSVHGRQCRRGVSGWMTDHLPPRQEWLIIEWPQADQTPSGSSPSAASESTSEPLRRPCTVRA